MHVDPFATLERQWAMLRMIPRFPRAITVAALMTALRDAGFRPSRRTIERDLHELSVRFPITVDDSGKTYRWSWTKAALIEFMPRLSVSQSVTLSLAKAHVRKLLPKAMLDDVQPVFDAAERELANTGWKDWHKRTAVAPAAFALLPPKIDAKVLSDVQHALAGRVCMTAKYRSKGSKTPKQRTIHPLGLLIRGSVQYLVCNLPEYKEPRQLAIHRMTNTVIGTEPCREPHGFSMSRYIAHDLSIASRGKIRLRAIFNASSAEHLRETALSKYQTWRPIEGTDKVEISATVDDDVQLKRWLLSFGSEVEVTEPEHLRQEMAEEIEKARRAYTK
ncbi:MAG TPA: WYL domain-containing protein [Xanthomonadaceae bacterium]|jgi:predicted DNA-binding transcriptional regulator YafY|nr:WYL domain-containing protein [Xanthomonadaceae bacterium]